MRTFSFVRLFAIPTRFWKMKHYNIIDVFFQPLLNEMSSNFI